MLQEIKKKIDQTCEKFGRKPSEIKIVAVTKGKSVAEIEKILPFGFPLGESRIQEAMPKIEALKAEFHLIGHLQTNKTKFAKHFSMIHSLDSLKLGQKLADFGNIWGFIPSLLIEVNINDPNKHGISIDQLPNLLKNCLELSLPIEGLMTVASRENPRSDFKILKSLRDNLGLRELSMGMSDDFVDAIEFGATIIRLGRALFGEK